VQGRHTLERALEILLDDSGLTYKYTDDETVIVRKIEESMLRIQPGAGRQAAQVQIAQVDAAPTVPKVAAKTKAPETADKTNNTGYALEEITVTGSRIAGAEASGTIAATVLSKDDIDTYGENGTGDILANLPQAGNFEINDSSDGPNSARGDVATVNLRGLGTGNTLILLNGRRIAPHGIAQDVGSVPRRIVNVNAFPSGAIDRIEVLRDGASAIYGSDATAGVVNTILSTNYDKTRVAVRQDFLEGTNSDEFTVNFATGLKFNNDKTKVIVTGSYFTRNGLFASELSNQFNTVDKRAFLGDNPFATQTNDFRNTSSSSPFGRFEVLESFDKVSGIFKGENVSLDSATTSQLGLSSGQLTTKSGVFHIQPCGFNSNSRVTVGTTIDGCQALGRGTLPSTLRFDFNGFQPMDSLGNGTTVSLDKRSALGRQLISNAGRYNLYTLVSHDFDNSIEAFGEFLYYRSTTEAQRAPSPLTTTDGIIIPKTNLELARQI